MSNIKGDFRNIFSKSSNQELDLAQLLANRLNPTAAQITDWLQSPQIQQWLNKQPMGITNALKMEAVNTIVSKITDNPDKDCRIEIGNSAIGVDVLRWQLWAFYRLPYARDFKAPDCPYTLTKHWEKDTRTSRI
ncbi:hypothetical protein LC593_35350 [Nostoc sp. CHAB 5844]|nr:hypothetical protein [Nostoc sp. CHAB 5844]